MKKCISLLLTLCLCLAVLPAFVLNAQALDTSGWLWPVKAVNAPADASNRNLYCKIMYRAYYDDHKALDISDYTGYRYAIRATKAGQVTKIFAGCVNHNGAAIGGSACTSIGCNPTVNGAPFYDKAYYDGKAFCGYGNGVVISHGGGVTSEYAHLSQVTVSNGQYVQQGDIIGYMGSTGASTGIHLHFSIKENGYAVNNNPLGDVLLKTNLWNGVDTIAYMDEPNEKMVNLGDHFYASISRAGASGEVLSVADAPDGSGVFAAAADQSAMQRWLFTRQGDGSYKIQATRSGYILNVDNGSSAQGTLATVWKDLGNTHQHWYIYESDGSYRITSKSTGNTLTVYSAASGQNAALYSYSGSAEQRLNIHIHNYTETAVPANCKSGGYTRYTCDSCKDSYQQPDGTAAADHDWKSVGYTEGTCQELRSEKFTCAICGENRTEAAKIIWSDWSEKKPSADQVETKQQYRFRDRQQNWAEAASGVVDYVASWPSGFNTSHSLYSQYNKTPKAAAETATEKVTIHSDNITGYIYYHWCRGTYTNGPINRLVSDCCEGDRVAFHAFYSTEAAGHTDASGTYVADVFYFPNGNCCLDSYWYFGIPVRQQSYTVEEKQFDGERWGDWSEWCDSAITENENRQVQIRTLYRYAMDGYGEHNWDQGVITKEPSATAAGEITHTCSLCGEKKNTVLPASPFVDVTSSDYYCVPVLWAVENNITNGLDATHFGPEAGCTRAHVVTFLWRSAGSPAPTSGNNPFADVLPGAYYYDAVLWAVEQGITTGLSATSFGPDQTCTRGQIVTFLWRFGKSPALDRSDNPFADVPADQYYHTAVLWAVAEGITNGIGNNLFAPNDPCTRGQIVTFLYRSVN